MTANKSTMRLKKSRFRGSSYCSPFLVWKNGLWNHWQQYYYLIWLHLRYPLKRETFQMKVYNMRGHLTLSNALSKSILKIPPICFLQCDWLIDYLMQNYYSFYDVFPAWMLFEMDWLQCLPLCLVSNPILRTKSSAHHMCIWWHNYVSLQYWSLKYKTWLNNLWD